MMLDEIVEDSKGLCRTTTAPSDDDKLIEWESVRLRASDQLSEVLFHDQNLKENFIDEVEKIHMKQRMMGVSFSHKHNILGTDAESDDQEELTSQLKT